MNVKKVVCRKINQSDGRVVYVLAHTIENAKFRRNITPEELEERVRLFKDVLKEKIKELKVINGKSKERIGIGVTFYIRRANEEVQFISILIYDDSTSIKLKGIVSTNSYFVTLKKSPEKFADKIIELFSILSNELFTMLIKSLKTPVYQYKKLCNK